MGRACCYPLRSHFNGHPGGWHLAPSRTRARANNWQQAARHDRTQNTLGGPSERKSLAGTAVVRYHGTPFQMQDTSIAFRKQAAFVSLHIFHDKTHKNTRTSINESRPIAKSAHETRSTTCQSMDGKERPVVARAISKAHRFLFFSRSATKSDYFVTK